MSALSAWIVAASLTRPTLELRLPPQVKISWASLERSVEQLGFGLESTAVNPSAIEVRLVEGPIRADPHLLGWSHEEPLIEISLPAVRRTAWRGLQREWAGPAEIPSEIWEGACQRVLTFTLKHELLVHQIGRTLPSRGRPYRMDTYTPGYLDSGDLHEVFWNLPTTLRPDHPYLLDRARRSR